MKAQVVSINSKVEHRSDVANNQRLRAKQLLLKQDREILANIITRHINTPFCSEFMESVSEARDGMFDAFMSIKVEMEK